MRETEPFYYSEFKCIGNECIDNCCEFGWTIEVDDDTIEKYKNIEGEYKNTLLNSISDKKTIILKNKSCPLLSENKLCSIYTNLGEEYMCKTCKIYPRYIGKYDNLLHQKSLCASCPIISEILVKCKEPIYFIENGDDLDESKNPLLNLLYSTKELSIEIAQFRDAPIWKRIYTILHIGKEVQNALNKNDILLGFEEPNKFCESETYFSEFLDKIEINKKDTSKKLNIIFAIFERLFRLKLFSLFNDTSNLISNAFADKIDSAIKFINEKSDEYSLKSLVDDFEEFEEYFKDREYIYENYIVYFIDFHYMKSFENKYLMMYLVNMCVVYSAIKFSIFLKWLDNGKCIEDDNELVNIIYSFARILEHDENIQIYSYNVLFFGNNNNLDKTFDKLISLIR